MPPGATSLAVRGEQFAGAHTAAATVAAETFRAIGIGVTLVHGSRPERWDPVYVPDFNVISFEGEYGKSRGRSRYNAAAIARAWQSGAALISEHAGFCDVFMPVAFDSGARATLASGPFLRELPDASALAERWRWLTRRQASLADPEFVRYVEAALGTLVLEGALLDRFVEALANFATLLTGRGNVAELGAKAHALRQQLLIATLVQRMWAAAEGFVDPRTSRAWHSDDRSAQLFDLKVNHKPELVIVGLFAPESAQAEQLELWLRRASFQRRVVEFAVGVPSALVGRVGDHGIVFLLPGGSRRRIAGLEHVAEQLRRLASRHGVKLVTGMGPVSGASLTAAYEVALAAAERALLEGKTSLALDRAPSAAAGPLELFAAQAEVTRALEVSVEHAELANERWLSAVTARFGFSVEGVRGYLTASLERVAGVVVRSEVFDSRSFESWLRDAAGALKSAQTLRDVIAAQRGAVRDAVAALQQPERARRQLKTRRALAHIHEHFTEALSVPAVARLVGLGPAAFSRLFHAEVGTTFVRYVLGLRLERARSLLESTELSVATVARVSGFRSLHYFHRAFAREFASAPGAYRKAS